MDVDLKVMKRRTVPTRRPLATTVLVRATLSRYVRTSFWDWNEDEGKSNNHVASRSLPLGLRLLLVCSQEKRYKSHPPLQSPHHLLLLLSHPQPQTWLDRSLNSRNCLTVPTPWPLLQIFCKCAQLGCISGTLTKVCYVFHFRI